MVLIERFRGLPVSFQDFRPLMIGVVLVCGVMLAGPLTSHASAADPFATAPFATGPTKTADADKPKSQPRVSLVERFSGMLSTPKVSQKSFDLNATAAADFGDWDQDAPR
jgi:hypothetical protein